MDVVKGDVIKSWCFQDLESWNVNWEIKQVHVSGRVVGDRMGGLWIGSWKVRLVDWKVGWRVGWRVGGLGWLVG